MSLDLGGPGELESANAVDQLLRHYDKVSGEWSLDARGRFWEAVKIAHRAGRTGNGITIAVLDGWCDTSIPGLRKRVRSRQLCPGASPVGAEHGTAVALLIGAVAPDAVLDFYGIADRFGRPQPDLVKRGFALAVETDVSLINLSAGRPRSWPETLGMHRGLPSGFGPLGIRDEYVGPEDCLWCGPADDAAAKGKVVVSAVGNNADRVFCPARSPSVISVGFFVEHRRLEPGEGGAPFETGAADQPEGYSQSSEVAYTISQPVDAIGSSFGAPLLTGALALGLPRSELAGWFAAAMLGSRIQTKLAGKGAVPAEIAALLRQAWDRVPHDHFDDPDPRPCVECSLFLEPLYTADALHWLGIAQHDRAFQRLTVAQRVMPWSPHAFVNMGKLFESVAREAPDRPDARDLLAGAIRLYETALGCTPPSLIAAQRLAELRA